MAKKYASKRNASKKMSKSKSRKMPKSKSRKMPKSKSRKMPKSKKRVKRKSMKKKGGVWLPKDGLRHVKWARGREGPQSLDEVYNAENSVHMIDCPGPNPICNLSSQHKQTEPPQLPPGDNVVSGPYINTKMTQQELQKRFLD